jgi:hypothetical protein
MFKRQEDKVETALDAQIIDSFDRINSEIERDEVELQLDNEILHLLELMRNLTAYDEEYDKMATAVAKLIQLRKNDAEEYSKMTAASAKLIELRKKDVITLETWMTVGTHLAGLFMLMNHERAHVIASKAFGLLKKIV